MIIKINKNQNESKKEIILTFFYLISTLIIFYYKKLTYFPILLVNNIFLTKLAPNIEYKICSK